MQCFEDTFRGTCSEDDMQHFLDTYYSVVRLEAELRQPDESTFFAEIDGKPVAYMRVCEAEPPFPFPADVRPLELSRLYVLKEYQGSGVAYELMKLYSQCAAETNRNYLWLGVWEYNHRAQRFYQKHGFEFTGHKHPFPIGETPQTDEWWAQLIETK